MYPLPPIPAPMLKSMLVVTMQALTQARNQKLQLGGSFVQIKIVDLLSKILDLLVK